jgi:hypothetical protein
MSTPAAALRTTTTKSTSMLGMMDLISQPQPVPAIPRGRPCLNHMWIRDI